MGCTDRHIWKWYTQTIISTHVQGMCMYIHSMNVYMQCMYMVHTTKSVQTHTRFVVPTGTQYIQKVILVYDSLVHISYMGCTDRHTWKWYTQTISSTHVQGMCMYIHSMNVYMQCMYMVHTTKSVQTHTGFVVPTVVPTGDWWQTRKPWKRQLWRKGACAELRLACVARLIGPDEKWSVVVELYNLRRVCTMYIHIFTIMNVYVQCTYITSHS